MATIQPAILQPGIALDTTSAAIYTASTVAQAIVRRAVFANVTGASTSLTVTVTRAGGSALVIVPGVAVSANEAYVSPELSGLVLGKGDVISASCGTASALNVFVSGFTQ